MARDHLQVLSEVGLAGHTVRSVGGGTRSDLWLQLIANVVNVPIEVSQCREAAALGAAVLAAVGSGYYPSPEHAIAEMCRTRADLNRTRLPQNVRLALSGLSGPLQADVWGAAPITLRGVTLCRICPNVRRPDVRSSRTGSLRPGAGPRTCRSGRRTRTSPSHLNRPRDRNGGGGGRCAPPAGDDSCPRYAPRAGYSVARMKRWPGTLSPPLHADQLAGGCSGIANRDGLRKVAFVNGHGLNVGPLGPWSGSLGTGSTSTQAGVSVWNMLGRKEPRSEYPAQAVAGATQMS